MARLLMGLGASTIIGRFTVSTNLPAKRKTGAPSTFTDKVFEEVCETIAQGNTLIQACQKVGINDVTFRRWVSASDFPADKALAYARARDLMLEAYADQLMHYTLNGGDRNNVTVNRDRLRMDSIKWLLSKMKPEKYGELIRVDQNVKIAKVAETPIDIEDAKVEWVKEHRS